MSVWCNHFETPRECGVTVLGVTNPWSFKGQRMNKERKQGAEGKIIRTSVVTMLRKLRRSVITGSRHGYSLPCSQDQDTVKDTPPPE